MAKTGANHKLAAVNFLKLVVAGRIDEAYSKYVDPRGKHHNVFFPAGFPALKKAMIENQGLFPKKRFEIQRVIVDGALVAVHSRLTMSADKPVMTVAHLFRFRGSRIVELWDLSQAVPGDSPNADGAF